MLTYSFEDRGAQTLYEYLYTKIRADILDGTLKAGEALPSKRAFAKNLNISTITVENTYAQLQTEGYIYSRPRRGFFVSDLSDAALYFRHSPGEPAEKMQAQDPAVKRRNTEDAAGTVQDDSGRKNRAAADAAVKETPDWWADFSSNQTQPDSFPFSTWAKLSREVLSEQKEQLMQNSPTQGILALREAIARHLQAFRGIQADPGRIVIGAGTEYLYGLLIQLFGMDKVYACENPGYRKVSQVFDSYRVRSRLIPMDEEGLSVEALAHGDANVVHVTPSHHFPTGITMPVNRRYELLGWAAGAPDRYLIEDDYDSELRMSGRPLPALFSMDKEGSVIYMNTFTKTLSSTIRVSYMVLPERLMERFRTDMSFYSCTVSNFEQYTLAHFIGRGYFEKHLNRMRNSGRKKRDLILDEIGGSGIGKITSIFEEHAGLHFLMNIALQKPAEEFLRELEQKQIRMTSLGRYYIQQPGDEEHPSWLVGDGKAEHTFVVNYSSVPDERIPEAVKRISEAAEVSGRS